MACKSNVNCTVFGCASVRKRNPELSFHSFPKEGQKVSVVNDCGEFEVCDRRQLWETKLEMAKKVSQFTRVCSLHFKNDDFQHSNCDLWSGKRILLKSAIPSVNLPRSTKALAVKKKRTEIKDAREQRLQGRHLRKKHKREELVTDKKNPLELQSVNFEAAETLILLGEQQPKYKEIGIQTSEIEVCKCFKNKNTKDRSVQVETSFIIIPASNFFKTNK